MNIHVKLEKNSYDVISEKGAAVRAGEIFDLNRKVMIVADSGLPDSLTETVAGFCGEPHIFKVSGGERSKSLAVFEDISTRMLQSGFDRGDCVLALGGGVAGDLAGFVAACYMRGIDFYNIPTTLLSQADSSIGGKTAVNLGGIKNVIGAFYQPKGVIIDSDVLKTLDSRQFACGAAEIIKMAAALDRDLFELIERKNIRDCLDEVTAGAVKLKAMVVEQDEKESGLRRVLNFGHTIGHGIESVTGLFHGECVALGMLPMSGKDMRSRLKRVLEREGLPVTCDADPAAVTEAAMHDKKAEGGKIITVQVMNPGQFEFISMDRTGLEEAYREVFL